MRWLLTVTVTISILTAACDGEPAGVETGDVREGLFTYWADAPRFEDCVSGQSWPVAMEAGYLDLERAYLAAAKPAPGTPLRVTVQVRIELRRAMEGNRTVPTAIIERHISLQPESGCD